MKKIIKAMAVAVMVSFALTGNCFAWSITGGTTSGSNTPQPSNTDQSSRFDKDDIYKVIEKGGNYFIPGVGTITEKSLKVMEWAAEKQIEGGGRVGTGSTVK